MHVDARARFLSAAAHEYVNTVPTVASSLMTQSVALSEQTSLSQKQMPNRNICLACGAIREYGWNCRASIIGTGSSLKAVLPRGRPHHSKLSKAIAAAKYIQYDCLHCHRFARYPVTTKERSSRRQEPAEKPSISESASTPARDTKMKKSRSRKNQGLQTLLAKSKETGGGQRDYGLDLMDVMKKPL